MKNAAKFLHKLNSFIRNKKSCNFVCAWETAKISKNKLAAFQSQIYLSHKMSSLTFEYSKFLKFFLLCLNSDNFPSQILEVCKKYMYAFI